MNNSNVPQHWLDGMWTTVPCEIASFSRRVALLQLCSQASVSIVQNGGRGSLVSRIVGIVYQGSTAITKLDIWMTTPYVLLSFQGSPGFNFGENSCGGNSSWAEMNISSQIRDLHKLTDTVIVKLMQLLFKYFHHENSDRKSKGTDQGNWNWSPIASFLHAHLWRSVLFEVHNHRSRSFFLSCVEAFVRASWKF